MFLIKKYLYNNIFNKVKNIHSVTFNEVGIVTIKGGANMKKIETLNQTKLAYQDEGHGSPLS